MVSVTDGVRRYLQFLVVERGLADNTVESYERDLRRYADFLAARGKRELTDVTQTDVAEFRTALRTGDEEHPPLAVSSVGRAVVAVRGLHAFALKDGLAQGDPAREVAPPMPAKRKTSHRTPSGAPSPRTSSTAARTSASYRSCSDTPR